jgi:hypothetical protein
LTLVFARFSDSIRHDVDSIIRIVSWGTPRSRSHYTTHRHYHFLREASTTMFFFNRRLIGSYLLKRRSASLQASSADSNTSYGELLGEPMLFAQRSLSLLFIIRRNQPIRHDVTVFERLSLEFISRRIKFFRNVLNLEQFSFYY